MSKDIRDWSTEILLDIDGVAANFIEGCRPIVEKMLGRRVKHDDVDQFMIEKALGLTEAQTAELYAHVMSEGWCRALPAYAGAKEAVAEMRAHATVVPVTAHFFSSKHWVYERDEWILEHLGIPKTDVVHTHRKFQIDGDALIDDKVSHLSAWRHRHPNGKAVLLKRKYNERDGWVGGESFSDLPAIAGYFRDVFGWPGLKVIPCEGRQP